METRPADQGHQAAPGPSVSSTGPFPAPRLGGSSGGAAVNRTPATAPAPGHAGLVRDSDYVYNTLASVASEDNKSAEYNFYVTILNYSQTKNTKGNGTDLYCATYIVTDESLMNVRGASSTGAAATIAAAATPAQRGAAKNMVLNIFGQKLSEIPVIHAVGDVMRIHRAHIDTYNGNKMLTANCKRYRSSFLTFHRRMDFTTGLHVSLSEGAGRGHHHVGLDEKEWEVKNYSTGVNYSWNPSIDAHRVRSLYAHGLLYLRLFSQKEDDPKAKEKTIALRNLKDAVDDSSNRMKRSMTLAAIESQETMENYGKRDISTISVHCDVLGMVSNVEICKDERGNEIAGSISLWDGTITEELQSQAMPSNLQSVDSFPLTLPTLKQAYEVLFAGQKDSVSNPNAPFQSEAHIVTTSVCMKNGLISANAALNETRKELRQKSLDHLLPNHLKEASSIESASVDIVSAMSQLLSRNINLNKVRVGFCINKSFDGVLERIKSLQPGTWVRLRNLAKFRPDLNHYQSTGILFDRSFKTRLDNFQEMAECNFSYQMAQIQPDTHICFLPPMCFDVMSVLSGCYDVYERSIAAMAGVSVIGRPPVPGYSASSSAAAATAGGGSFTSSSSSSNNNNSNNRYNSNSNSNNNESANKSSTLASTRSKRPLDDASGEPFTPLCLAMVSPVPARYNCKAKIIGFNPANISHFASKTAGVGAGEEDFFDYLFSITIEDDTDTAEVIFHGDAAAQFIGAPASVFAMSKDIKNKIKANLTALIDKKTEFALSMQMYYADVPTSSKSKGAKGGGPLTLKSAIDKVASYRNSGVSVRISATKTDVNLMDNTASV